MYVRVGVIGGCCVREGGGRMRVLCTRGWGL